jgi:hypothetical protein
MNNIECDALWACPVHGGTGGMQGRDETGVIHCASCQREAVEYVPINQLEEAASLLGEIGRLANTQDAIPDDANVLVQVPLRLIRAARAITNPYNAEQEGE